MLKELARSAPTLFYLHVSEFFDCLGEGLKDPNIAVRECTLEALRCALSLVSHREHNHRHQWYHAIYQDAFEGLMVCFSYLFSFTFSLTFTSWACGPILGQVGHAGCRPRLPAYDGYGRDSRFCFG